ncbi:MAG: hypothetical protein HRU19_19810 [Pseudobacteriovorax sp.]|nr:hypothetical protein [Pseudobacteriovorax sp.]
MNALTTTLLVSLAAQAAAQDTPAPTVAPTTESSPVTSPCQSPKSIEALEGRYQLLESAEETTFTISKTSEGHYGVTVTANNKVQSEKLFTSCLVQDDITIWEHGTVEYSYPVEDESKEPTKTPNSQQRVYQLSPVNADWLFVSEGQVFNLLKIYE